MPNALKQYAEARPTPRNKLMGLLADTLTQANEFATLMDPRYENKRQNQTLGLLADAVSLGSLAKTADRMSYGEPLTNAGKANVPFMKPETADALMMAPLSPRNALAMMGAGMADNGMMKAATVWHGSPHKFDKFDASKIGTGEGAQAYGHGLYLAESPAVAGQYKSALSGPATTEVGGVPIDSISLSTNARSFVNQVAGSLQRGGKLDDEIAGLELNIKYGHPDAADMREALAVLRKGVDRGNLYKVDLPDDAISKMLDWDKPLRDQPNVMQALGMDAGQPLTVVKEPTGWAVQNSATGEVVSRNWADEATARKFAGLGGANSEANLTGQAFYRARHEAAIRAGKAKPAAEKEREAVEALRKAGIPGIRYLDGGSRTAGSGTRNFVVFPGNEGLLSILERNGQPLK